MRNLVQNLPVGEERMLFSHGGYTLQHLSFPRVGFSPLAVYEPADVMCTKTQSTSATGWVSHACPPAFTVVCNALAFGCFPEEVS